MERGEEEGGRGEREGTRMMREEEGRKKERRDRRRGGGRGQGTKSNELGTRIMPGLCLLFCYHSNTFFRPNSRY